MNLKKCLFECEKVDVALLVLRLGFGAGMVYHGFGKVFGESMPYLINGVSQLGFPFPAFFAWSAAIAEFVGGAMLMAGALTRVSAVFIGITMFVAAFGAHLHDPFAKKELALAYLVVATAIYFSGAGRYSVDARLKD